MRKFYSIIFSAVIVCAASCQKDTLKQGEVPDGTVFTGSSEFTKITMGGESSGKIPAIWENGDRISVFNTASGSKAATGTLYSGAGSQTASFKCDATIAAGTKVRVLYPSTATLSEKNNIPAAQTATTGKTCLPTYSFAYSNEITVNTTANPFTLKHVPAYMKLSLSSSDYDGYKLNSFTIQCEGAVLAGDFTVNFNNADVITYANGSDKITVTLSSPMTIASTSQDVWFAVLPCDLTDKKMMIELNLTDTGGKALSPALRFSGKKVESGKVYTLKLGNPTLNWFDDIDKSQPEYTTIAIKWKSSFGANYSTKVANMATGMNWMKRVREGYSAQDSWGGDMSVEPDCIISSNPAGFWRVGRFGSRTVMVTPDNHIGFLRGMNNLSPEPFSEASTTTSAAKYNSAFATDDAFASWAGQKMKEMGFNVYCSNADRITRYRSKTGIDGKTHTNTPAMEQAIQHPDAGTNICQVENLYFMRTFYYDQNKLSGITPGTGQPILVFCFDPDWLTYIDEMAGLAASMFKDNRNFIGYFFDNELPVAGTGEFTDYTTTLENWLRCCSEDAIPQYGFHRALQYAREWALDWMQENYGTTEYDARMETSFQAAVYDYYFRTCTEAIRRNDPNHLILGSRICQPHRDVEVYMRACAKYCDVVSINYYGHNYEAGSDIDTLTGWLGDTPFIVTEFHVKCTNTQNADDEGAGDFVSTQDERGRWYNNYCISMIRKGNCAGLFWFKLWNDYRDRGGWVTKGIVDVNNFTNVYTNCTNLMCDFNRNSIQVLKYYSDARTDVVDETAGALDVVYWY